MIICELLVNGNPPSAIPVNIQTIYSALNRSELNELPSLDYVRKCFVVVQKINKIRATCRLEKGRELAPYLH